MRDVIESRNGLICYSEKRREKPSWVRRKKAEIERSRAGAPVLRPYKRRHSLPEVQRAIALPG